ncbi:MAG: alpha/beta fold hydrolase [Mycobacteriales bacterium]
MNLSSAVSRRTLYRWIAPPVAVAMAGLAAIGPASATAGPTRDTPGVSWQACPSYSDDILRAIGIGDPQLARARELLDRMECGTVTVPLDYAQPRGRKITVAITRLKAVDQGRRLGSLAINPGGPGGSGYLTPLQFMMLNDADAHLNDRYDLIGFDPRGVGYSTKVECALSGGVDLPGTGPVTEAQARTIFDAGVAANRDCAASDPAFLGQLTTLNVARDLDSVRAALGERRISFLGVSWGTSLGAVYRSNFPGHVGRMFLDSVADPNFRLDDFQAKRAAATERDFSRMAAWLAERAGTYQLGDTADEVTATVRALREDYDAHPRQYTDLPNPVDGSIVALTAGQQSIAWPVAGQVLAELLHSAGGGQAPPTLKAVLGRAQEGPPPGGPERYNAAANTATQCNEDPSRLDFADAWAAYQRILANNPVTGRMNPFYAGCAGWSLPVRTAPLRRTGGSLVLSGHRYEGVAPYQWTLDMQALVGGRVFTVSDDIHGSVLQAPECGGDMVGYFNTGRVGAGCAGITTPSSANPAGAAPLSFAGPAGKF